MGVKTIDLLSAPHPGNHCKTHLFSLIQKGYQLTLQILGCCHPLVVTMPCTTDVKEIDAFVLCKKTRTLLPVPETLNYFDLFGLPEPTFKIDLKALGKKHKRLQTILHPDRFSLASEDQV